MSNRRNFIKQASLLSAATLAGKAATARLAQPAPPKQALGFVIPPYLQHLTPDSVCVMFITAANAYSWVEFGEEGADTRRTQQENDGLVEAYVRLNKIPLTGLKPGTTYRYRACSKPITLFEPYKLEYGEQVNTSWFSFTTPVADADTVSCLILNDIHDSPEAFGKLLGLVKDRPFDFVALNGDTFDYQVDEQQLIDHLFLPCTRLFASERPFVMVRGNHETRGKFRREFKEYFNFPADRYHFSFKQGPVYWVILDTGEDKPDDHPVYAGIVDFDAVRERQAKWLAEIVETDDYQQAAYRVVLMHIPPFHHNDWHGPLHCQRLFNPIFNDNNVDLVISGHTHRYGVHPPDANHHYPIIIGGGSREGSRTIIHLSAANDRLQLDMIRDDGTVVGNYTIEV